MLRTIHSLPGLFAALLVAALATTGAILSLDPALERARATVLPARQISVAALAQAAKAHYPQPDRIVRTASGSVIVYYYDGDRPAADLVDLTSGRAIGPYQPSGFTRFITNLHRSLFLGEAGRLVVGIAALTMVLLTVSGTMMLAVRMGGWRRVLRPVRGSTTAQRLHVNLGRTVILGLLISGLTGSYMSLTTFGVVPDGMAVDAPVVATSNGGPRLPVGKLPVLQSVDLANLRELTFPSADNPLDIYSLTTSDGFGQIDAATGLMLSYQPHSLARRIYEAIYMLHTGQGLWPLGLVLGLAALAVPFLTGAGLLIWRDRRRELGKLPRNVSVQSADTVILVGSEGNSTWGFAATLHAELTNAGFTVHTGAMNHIAKSYAQAKRLLILTATYGDGAAPASANRFLARLPRVKTRLPTAILGFGDRSFLHYCKFAEDSSAALREQGWPSLLPLKLIDRNSTQQFAQWGVELGALIGKPVNLAHAVVRPKTIRLELMDRVDYGVEVQAPTAVLRFRAPEQDKTLWQRLRARRLPPFEAGDLVGILPPGSASARFYSLVSSSADGMLEICVRKHTGGLCSTFLHDLEPGALIEVYIQPNPAFRPSRGKAPLILIGAGTGVGPLAGFIRHNVQRRPVHLFWGGRDPNSDFLYRDELTTYLDDRRLTRLHTAFSRVSGGSYVQTQIALEAAEVRGLIEHGAQILVCGGREMAEGVARVLESIVDPIALSLQSLKTGGRYIEDVY